MPSKQRTQPKVDTEFIDGLRNAVTLLARAQRAAGARMHKTLPFSLMSTLSTLQRVGPKTPTELATLEGVSKPSMTRALATLEGRGLVVRTEHPTDARQQLVLTSKAGVKAVRETRLQVNKWYHDHLAELSSDDREAIEGAVDALLRLAEQTH